MLATVIEPSTRANRQTRTSSKWVRVPNRDPGNTRAYRSPDGHLWRVDTLDPWGQVARIFIVDSWRFMRPGHFQLLNVRRGDGDEIERLVREVAG